MKTVNVKQFVALREALIQEQAGLETRLAQINQALANSPLAPVAAFTHDRCVSVDDRRVPMAALVRPGRRPQSKLSLATAVSQVTRSKALTKDEIMAAIAQLGYRFKAKKPINSLSNLLYTPGKFKNADGKFSPAK